ncbi:MAG: T9SS type A sorting domain-containing protein [Ignavibacteria bacterium]
MKSLLSILVITIFLFLSSSKTFAQITVTSSIGLDGNYTTLTGAGGVFETFNSGPAQTSAFIRVKINANITESGANALNEGTWAGFQISSTNVYTISGTVDGAPLIDLNGADSVYINGFVEDIGIGLTISNLSTSSLAGTSTIRLKNGATTNEIIFCNVLGSSQTALNTEGGTIVIGTDVITPFGNDYNRIYQNYIGPATSSLPVKAIMGLGSFNTAAIRNDNNFFENNNIYDFFGSGAVSTSGINVLAGNNAWVIAGNKIYQTAPRVFTSAALRYSGITLNNAQASLPGYYTVSENVIGFGSDVATGITAISGSSNEFRGIDVASVNTAALTSIYYNTISGITQTSSRSDIVPGSSPFIGIAMGTDGGYINATINKIGSLTGSTTIALTLTSTIAGTAPVIGIYNSSTSDTEISSNEIGYISIAGSGGMTGFRGILVNTDNAVLANVQGNTISNISNSKIGNYVMNGIQCILPDVLIIHNIVRNFTGGANGAAVVMSGIIANGSTGDNIVEKNQVYNLVNTVTGGFVGAIYGIDLTFPETINEVKQNVVYALEAVTTFINYQLIGMVRNAGGNARVYNNMISLGLRTNGSSITTGFSIIGIRDNTGGSGSWNYYYNTVYIGGSGVAAPGNNSYALLSNVVNNPRDFKNNILINVRGNLVSGGAEHFAYRLSGVGVNPAGLTSNFNNLYASGTDGVLGFYDAVIRTNLANWQLATGQDGNSSSVSVNFVDPANGNLRLAGPSVGDETLIGMPIPGIYTDIDKQLRDLIYPYMGANEGVIVLPVELTSFTSSVINSVVVLNWGTSSELNNSGFDIERSDVKGQTSKVWTKIGSVTGNGTSTVGHNYSYTDRNLSSGTYSYRLKQIDFNGNFEYFNLSNEVNIGIPTKFELSQNYPNPFNPSTKINYDLPVDGKVSLIIFDLSGKEVKTLVNEVKTAGYYTVNFNGANLSSGVYFYRINLEGQGISFAEIKKMTLIK